jgi:hypothetical protein
MWQTNLCCVFVSNDGSISRFLTLLSFWIKSIAVSKFDEEFMIRVLEHVRVCSIVFSSCNVKRNFGCFRSQGGVSETNVYSVVERLILWLSRQDDIIMLNEGIAFGLFSYKTGLYLDWKSAKYAGFWGIDLSLRAYCAERTSLRCDKSDLFVWARRLSHLYAIPLPVTVLFRNYELCPASTDKSS